MKRFGFVVLLVLAVLLLVGALAMWNQVRRPLGPGLELSTELVNTPTVTQLAALIDDSPAPTQAPPTATVEAPATKQSPTPSVVAARNACGGEGAVSLLVLGLSSPDNLFQRGAGAIRLVRVDFDHSSATVLTLPPELMVKTSKFDTLTHTYWLARRNIQGTEEERNLIATQALAQALLDNYGYVPDHYITINQSAFGQVIDSLGGITVNIPEAIQEVPEGWHTFEAGEQTLSSEQLLDYVRLINRANQSYASELERLGRQNTVIQAALDAALEPANWGKLLGLAKDFDKLFVTDLSTDQLLNLACMFREVGGQARSLAIPPQAVDTDGMGRAIVDPEIVRLLIDDLLE
jgi:LCP family protein required for cell wall assembly